MPRTASTVATVAGILLAALLAPLAFAEETETIAFEKLSDAQRSTISSAGVAALRGISEARVSLKREDGPAARRALGGAGEQLQLIRSTSPSASLGDGIGELHDQLVRGEGGNPQDLEPLYTRLDAYQEVVGVDAAEELRGHLDRAKSSLAAGENEDAVAILEDAGESIRYVEIDLPVRETHARVNRAVDQIGDEDFLGADGNLRASLGSLQTFGEMASIEMGEELEAVGTGPE